MENFLKNPNFEKRIQLMNLDDNEQKTLSISKMCAMFKVTPRTLRFYESKELIFPIRKGQKRLYTRRDIARLKLILQGKRFGFALEKIRQLLNLYHIGDEQITQLSETYKLAEERLKLMKVERDELNSAIVDLQTMLRDGEKMLNEKGVQI